MRLRKTESEAAEVNVADGGGADDNAPPTSINDQKGWVTDG